jgi:hypothetical protein
MADTPESVILSEVALFRGLPAEQLSTIGTRLRRRTFPASAHGKRGVIPQPSDDARALRYQENPCLLHTCHIRHATRRHSRA